MKSMHARTKATIPSLVKAVLACSVFFTVTTYAATPAPMTIGNYETKTLYADYVGTVVFNGSHANLNLNGHNICGTGTGIGITSIGNSYINITGWGNIGNFTTGIYISGGQYNHITNCAVGPCTDWGIGILSSPYVQITGVNASAQNYEGILLNSCSYPIVSYSTLWSGGRCGIIGSQGFNTYLNQLTVSGCATDGICMLGENAFALQSNRTTGNTGNGVSFSYNIQPCSGDILSNESSYNLGYGFKNTGATLVRFLGFGHNNALGLKNW
jgi:hypothetical protein